MKTLSLLLLTSLFSVFNPITAQTFDSGLYRPWTDPRRALVLDGYNLNFVDVNWDKLVTDKRIAGVIYRASGPVSRDVWTIVAEINYQKTRQSAKSRNLLWGSYHVGMADHVMPAAKQAQFYLKSIDRSKDEVMALDLEDFSKTKYMKLDGAKTFIKYIYKETGRYPIVYVSGSVYNKIITEEGKDPNTVFAKTKLWFVRAEDNIEQCLNKAPKDWWRTYELWQIASEINCKKVGETYCDPDRPVKPTVCPFDQEPKGVFPAVFPDGTKRDMDIDIYNGTVEQLRARWPFS